MSTMSTPEQRKQTGTYYTDRRVAQFLVDIAVMSPTDHVLEPCFGEGVFIEAWERRAQNLGGGSLVGCDLDAAVVADARERYPAVSLIESDFFDLTPGRVGQFDAVVGNPPFVRYHRFQGTQRAKGLRRATESGVRLSALTSAWVPFLIHATRYLRPHGRLAVVAPFELTYARYARPFVQYLGAHFGSVRVLLFHRPLFPELNESTVLLLADGWGDRTDRIHLVHLPSAEALTGDLTRSWTSECVALADWEDEGTRSQWFALPDSVRGLYSQLEATVPALGSLARLTIGYVTGNNTWFHASEAERREWGLTEDVQVALRRSADLMGRGLALNADDMVDLGMAGAHWVFTPREPLSEAATVRIRAGERVGVAQAYKCRVRQPWWRIPGVVPHDFVIGVLSNTTPRLVASAVPATNTLLVGDVTAAVAPRVLAAAAVTSLAALSAELVGHPLGGGALKLEPAEARRWRLPVNGPTTEAVLAAIDAALRAGDGERATALADAYFLSHGLGLSDADIATLRTGVQTLRLRRMRSHAV